MSAQRDSYNKYLEQFAGQPMPEKTSTMLLRGAELISRFGGKIDGSGEYEATYRLPDGRIAELYHSFSLAYLFVWESQEAYSTYQTPMPFGVYHEF